MRKNQLKKNSLFYILAILNCLYVISCQKKLEDSTFYKLLNSKYKHDTILTTNMPDNALIISNLTKELEKNDMEITAYKIDETEPDYNFVFDCVNLIEYHIESTGMRAYSIKSNTKSIKYHRKNRSNKRFSSYYKKFNMCIYEFESEEIANKNFETIEKARSSGNGMCNKTFNTHYVLKKNEIFEFSTMDEKSLHAMREYINFVQNQ